MIVCMKSISLKQEADDVINQILHTLFPFFISLIHPAKSSFLYLLWMDSQWKDRHGFHKQFILNCRKIGCRSLREDREERKKKRMKLRWSTGHYSPRLSLSFHRVLPFQNNPQPPFQPPPPTAPPFIRRFKCINGPEPSWTILALSLMKTLCGWIPVQ